MQNPHTHKGKIELKGGLGARESTLDKRDLQWRQLSVTSATRQRATFSMAVLAAN